MKKKKAVLGIIFITTLTLITACGPKKKQEQVSRVIPVEVYVAKPDSISSYIRLTGGVEAQNDAFVYSKITEKLVSLNVKPGDRVKAGQILGVQYNEGAKQSTRAAEANFKSAQIQLQTRKDDHQRMENLLAKGAITKQQFDQTKSLFDVAASTLEQATAAMLQSNVLFENAIIKAPFDGQVAMIYFDANEMIPAGQPVIKIVNANTVKAKLKIPEVDINGISIGQTVKAVFPSMPESLFTGTVYRIDGAIDPMTRTLEVEIRLANPGNFIKSGLFGEFRIETAKHTSTIVVSDMTILTRMEIKTNDKGIQTEHPDHYVFLVKDSKATKQSIQTGLFSNGLIEITKGIIFGDSIIVAGQNIVKNGDLLRIVSKQDDK